MTKSTAASASKNGSMISKIIALGGLILGFGVGVMLALGLHLARLRKTRGEAMV